MSNTGQTAMESFFGREVETPQGMVHIVRVKVRVRSGDGVRLTPQRLAVEEPRAMVLRQAVESGSIVLHDKRMMPQISAAPPGTRPSDRAGLECRQNSNETGDAARGSPCGSAWHGRLQTVSRGVRLSALTVDVIAHLRDTAVRSPLSRLNCWRRQQNRALSDLGAV